MRALDIASTGMQAQQTNVEVISNNLANMTTTGFKRQRAEFQDLIYQNLRRVGSNSSDSGSIVPSGAQVGLGVKTAAIYRINEQGNLQQTSNTLDLAIQGSSAHPGDSSPSGDTAYTRDGTFGLAPDGTIVTADGYVVQPGIQIPNNATNVTINTAGQVQATIAGQTRRIGKGGELQLTYCLRCGLARDGRLHLACGVDGDVGCVVQNLDAWLHDVTISGDDRAVGCEAKRPIPRVRRIAGGKCHLEITVSLDREVQRVRRLL